MVKINPEWLQYSPDDFSGLEINDLLCKAGVFARSWRQFWITLFTEDVTVDAEEVNLMERVHHAFSVAIKCRKREVMQAIGKFDIPVGNVDCSTNAMIAASLYERAYSSRGET